MLGRLLAAAPAPALPSGSHQAAHAQPCRASSPRRAALSGVFSLPGSPAASPPFPLPSPHPPKLTAPDLDWGDFFFNLVSMCIVYAYFSEAAVAGESQAAIVVSMCIAAVDILLLALRWLWWVGVGGALAHGCCEWLLCGGGWQEPVGGARDCLPGVAGLGRLPSLLQTCVCG